MVRLGENMRASCVSSLVIASVCLPLLMVFVSIALSPWFNIWYNALSDLGHAVNNDVAPIFNLGLVIGGYLVSVLSIKYMILYDKGRSVILAYAGFMLILIGVYDEIYGRLHFIVSVLFFLGIIAYLFYISVKEKTIIPGTIAILQIIMWYLHLFRDLPPGAAIPELIAVFSFAPFYYSDYVKLNKELFMHTNNGRNFR